VIRKLLIANRGESACRIVASARRLGIATVAVYSEVDAGALHVRLADEAHPLGGAAPRESYLAIDRVLAAAGASGADAVHPGYGFLSENPDFARAVSDAGLVFVGPPAEVIALMGDKAEAKRLAAAAGLDTVPGHPEPLAGAEAVAAVARAVGFPLVLKAIAGGGGRGLRVVPREEALLEAFAAARREAEAAFGDGRLLCERYIERPRHVEVQVLADHHGQVVHLGERECSLQRRHQKVIEEAPAPGLDEALRARLGTQAVALARAVGYRSAGTVEFVLGADGGCHFLEMNTRLQVEHPVTERVTGVDIVEQMLRIAAGERLTIAQDTVRLEGSAVEARLYAEDPGRGFAPSAGRLMRYRPPPVPPPVDKALRIDAGVDEGDRVPLDYDPLIAKVIAWGPERGAALERLADALDAFIVRGVRHNLDFLAGLVAHPAVLAGPVSTRFIEETFAGGYPGTLGDDAVAARVLACAGAIGWRTRPAAARSSEGRLRFAALIPATGEAHALAVQADRSAIEPPVLEVPVLEVPVLEVPVLEVEVGGRPHRVESRWRPGEPLFLGLVDGASVCVQVERAGRGWRLAHRGRSAVLELVSPRVAALWRELPAAAADAGEAALRSPMPGVVLQVLVAVGDALAPGAPVAVVEAMKTETTLRAERPGRVARVLIEPGATLEVDQAIVELEVS